MTPSLIGRWQTRVAFMLIIGLPVALVLKVAAGVGATPAAITTVVAVLTLIGLLLDIVYDIAQSLRREGDWPPLFSVYGLGLEATVLLGLLQLDALPFLPRCLREEPDLMFRRMVCRNWTLEPAELALLTATLSVCLMLVLTILLPILLPDWSLRQHRLWPGRRRRR